MSEQKPTIKLSRYGQYPGETDMCKMDDDSPDGDYVSYHEAMDVILQQQKEIARLKAEVERLTTDANNLAEICSKLGAENERLRRLESRILIRIMELVNWPHQDAEIKLMITELNSLMKVKVSE